MSSLKQATNKFRRPIAAACMLAVITMGLLGIIVYRASIRELLIMFIFALFYVQLPGLFLIHALSLNNERLSTTLMFGFFTGWAYEIVVYFISDILPTDLLLYIGGPVLSAFFLVKLFRYPDSVSVLKRMKWSQLSAAFCIFIVLVFLYCIINTQYLYVSPAFSESTTMNADKAYHIGLINSLAHDYPMQSPWIQGIYINYHIFSELLLSIPVRLFGVSSDFTTFSFGPYLTSYCFGLSMYSFFREMSNKPNRAGLYCLIVLLSNLYITRTPSTSLAFTFMLINDNSSGYGIAASFMTFVALKKWYASYSSNDSHKNAYLLLSAAFLMLTTGIKGPMGAVLIAALWGSVILGIILRKVPIKVIIPTLACTAGFILIYETILGSKGQSNTTGASVIKFGTITNIAFWKKPLIGFLNSNGLSGPVVLMAILLVFAVFFLTVFFVPFCIGYIRELYLVILGKKSYELINVMVYAACAVGLIAMFFLNYSGHSQVYFGLVTVSLVPVVSFWLIEDLSKDTRGSRFILRLSMISMMGVLIFTTASLAVYFSRHADLAVQSADPTVRHSGYMSVTNDEYEAMEWIDKNTEYDSLLATDRYYSVDPEKYSYENRWDNRFFLYAVYSNRFTYISGSGYSLPESEWPVRKEMIETNNKLYDEAFENRGDLARQLDIDYVVVSKRYTEVNDLSNEDYDLCFSNDDVDIYKIRDTA